MDGVGDPGDELVGVLVVAGGGVVEEVVRGADVGCEAFVDGQQQRGGEVGRVGRGVVEGGEDVGRLGEDQFFGQGSAVGLKDRGADEVLAGGEDLCSVDDAVDVALLFVVDVGLEVELLLVVLDGGVADAGAEGLLEREALRVVVVEADVAESVEPGREVLVAFAVRVEDAAEGGDGGCGRCGLRNGAGRGVLAVGFHHVEGGAVARSKPGHRRDGTEEVERGGEGVGAGGGADQGDASSGSAGPGVEEALLVGDLLVELGLGDEVVDVLGGDGGGSGDG